MSRSEHPEYRIGRLEATVAELTAQLEQAHKINNFLLQQFANSAKLNDPDILQTPPKQIVQATPAVKHNSVHLKSQAGSSSSTESQSEPVSTIATFRLSADF